MSLRNLTEGNMYILLVYWLGPLREQIDGHPALRYFIEPFETLRDAFRSLRRDPRALVAAARLESTAADSRHDDRLRALWFAFIALEYAADDPEVREALRDARARVLDGGLPMVNRSYGDEAAEADLVMSRIDEHVIALMRAHGFGPGTLYDAFEAWRDAARELGEREYERSRVEHALAEQSGAGYSQIRGDWIQTVKAFRGVVALVEPTRQALLLGKLDEAEARADARVATRRASRGDAAATAAPDDADIFPEDGSTGRDELEPEDAATLDEIEGAALDDAADDDADGDGER